MNSKTLLMPSRRAAGSLNLPEEVVIITDYLNGIALEQNLRLDLAEERAKYRNGVVVLPACLSPQEPFGNAEQLQTLEDAWNNQEPRPSVMLILELDREV